MMDAAQITRQSLQSSGYEALRDSMDATAAQQTAQTTQTGSAMGLSLETIADPTADLMDSMEELTAQFEEKTLKDVGQRKLGKTRMGAGAAFVKAIEEWQKQFSDLPNKEFLGRVLKQFKQGQTGPGDLLKQLGRGSGDPSHQFAMLDILEKAVGGDGKLEGVVREAKRMLEAEKGAEVRAGINIAQEVNARAKTPEEMKDLRDLYRGETIGFKNPQHCFRSLVESRGAERLGESVDFLTKSCGIDLQNPSPSQSPEELRRILVDLQCVNVLKSMLDSCEGLTRKIPRLFQETSLLNGLALAGKVADLTEDPFPSADSFASLQGSCGFAKRETKIYFNTQLMDVMRSLSPRLFAEDGDRFKLLDAAQEHLDSLIKEEEMAMLAEGKEVHAA